MTSLDTNILLPLLDSRSPHHAGANRFVESIPNQDDVGISEFALLELYGLLRNPAVVTKPRSAQEATEVCQALRNHPHWRVLGFPLNGAAVHNEIWRRAAQQGFPRRRIYDVRLGLSLVYQGVTCFATVNVRDFEDLGFHRVWNPLS